MMSQRNGQPSQGGEVHLSGVWLLIARLGCASVTLLSLVIWLWGLPYRYAQFATICTAQCGDQQPTPDIAQLFQAARLTVDYYSAFMGTVEALFAATFMVFAALIFWRKSDTVIGLLTTLLLATTAVTQTDGDALASASSLWAPVVNLIQPLSFIALVMFLYLFPDGRFAPRWTGWLVLVWSPIFLVTSAVVSPADFLIPLFAFLVFSLFAQVYRYRQVSTPLQRQQTKWVMFAVIVALLGSIILVLAGDFLHIGQFFGAWGLLTINTALYLLSVLIPISIGVSIARFRLWDLDALINKALVYGLLSATLAVIFAGVILGLETIAGAFIASSSLGPIALVISTLLVAALFQPLRARLQSVIDQRFYRHKYDATRTLQAFGATLRGEVELADLSESLVAAVQETMQPASITLWLRSAQTDTAREVSALPQ
jgi:hypothetical protein